MNMKRSASIVWIAAAILVSCSGPGPEPEHSAVVRLEGEPDVLNTTLSTSPFSNYVLVGALGSMLCEQLLRYDATTGLPTVPGLAAGYPEVSDDHRVYTFTIREGVKWQDGRPFSAEDVLFTVKAAMTPSVDSAAFRSYFSSLADAELVGSNRIRFHMSEPYWLNDASLSTNIVPLPRHVFDPDGLLDRYKFRDIVDAKAAGDPVLKKFGESFNSNPANRAPVCTGPYKLEKWTAGQELVLVRNEQYLGEKPHLDKVVYKIIPDATTALTALKSGQIDFVPRLAPAQFHEQTGGRAFQEQFVKTTYHVPQMTYIGWNETRPFFADKRVRQALTMLVDREKVIEAVRRGMGSMAASPFAPGSPDFNPNIQPLPYDRQRALALLDETGWTDHNGNGIRDKNGIEFKFEILVSASNAAGPALLDILQDAFGKAGMTVTGRRLEAAVFQSTLRDQKMDASIGNWITSLQFDPHQLLHSDSARNRGSNYFNFRNAEADALMEQARIEFDAEKRKQLYWRFQEIFHDEQPYTLLYYPADAAAYHNRFQNVQFLHQRPGYDLTLWSVAPGVQRVAAAIEGAGNH